MAGKRLSIVCVLILGLLLLPAAGFSQENTDDEVTDTADDDDDNDDNPFEDAGSVACLKDSDCDEGEVCRDEGICISSECSQDEDCDYEGYICHSDGLCVPEVCLWDSDCMEHQLCLDGECKSDPAMYIEGGVANCHQGGHPLAAFLLLLTLGLIARRRALAH